MININLIFPEIFISLSIMFLLIFGVYKKNSSELVYSLSIISLLIVLALCFNLEQLLRYTYLTKVIKLVTFQLL